MQEIYDQGKKKNCAICRHKTNNAYEYGYAYGITIRVPVCEKCKGDVGMCLSQSMDAHLKAISNAVAMSRIITDDERQLQEIYRRKRENE